MGKVVIVTVDFTKLEKHIEEMHSRFAELNSMDSWTIEEERERLNLKNSLFASHYSVTGRGIKVPPIRNIKGNPNV